MTNPKDEEDKAAAEKTAAGEESKALEGELMDEAKPGDGTGACTPRSLNQPPTE